MNLQLPKVGDDDHGEEEKAIQYLSLDRVQYIVVDEADRMLDISFHQSTRSSFTELGFQRTTQSYVWCISFSTISDCLL